MHQIEFYGADGTSSRHPLSGRPLHVGRGAQNDIVLTDDAVSTRHLRVWAEPDGVRIEDLGSRNGTWLDGARITGVVTLPPGREVRIGATARLRAREAAEGDGAVPRLLDMELGLFHAFSSDRLTIGDVPGAHVHLPGAGSGVTLLVQPDGQILLGGAEDLVEIEVDRPFTVAGRRFCLRHAPPEPGVTRDLLLPHELPPARYPYEVEARLDGVLGPEATFRDPRSGAIHRFVATNPALLVYLLARRTMADAASGVAEADRGWLADDELGVGIWGRSEAARQVSHLNVLVWRVRKELQAAGFDAWCLEKRRRYLRLRADAVRVA
jgi:hypothetical protein